MSSSRLPAGPGCGQGWREIFVRLLDITRRDPRAPSRTYSAWKLPMTEDPQTRDCVPIELLSSESLELPSTMLQCERY